MISMINIKCLYRFGHGSKAWFLNHVNDFYVKKANNLNYRSRASFKLLEILKKHPKLIQQFEENLQKRDEKQRKQKQSSNSSLVKNVLDLGCAPGSWSQVLRQMLLNSNIVAVDLLEMKPIKGVQFYHCDARNKQLHKKLFEKFGKFGLIVSDMAPNFDGDSANTHVEMLQLNLLCVQLCYMLGSSFCSLVIKSVQGEYQKNFFNVLSTTFESVHRQKPDASRSQSMQFFYVCQKIAHRSQKQKSIMAAEFQKMIEDVNELRKYKTKKQSIEYIQRLFKQAKN